MDLDLREFAQWPCYRAAHPARFQITGLGIRSTSPWVVICKAVPVLGFSLGDVKAEIFF